jgi:uncharacterized membrane protein
VKRVDGARIRETIDAAERGTTGRIGVRIANGKSADALEDARAHFMQAGLHEHPHRNAVVFFVAPGARRFAVVGDAAIHERAGQEFWHAIVEEMQPHLHRGDITAALVHGIERVGAKLREHFPEQVQV